MLENVAFLDTKFYSNSIAEYLLALLITVSLYFILQYIFKGLLIKSLIKWARKTETRLDDLIAKTLGSLNHFFFIFVSLFIGISFLKIDPQIQRGINALSVFIVTYYVVRGVQDTIIYILEKVMHKHAKSYGTTYDPSIVHIISVFSNFFIWLIAFIFILQNLGVNVATLIGGLGITGIAVAFALQNVLSDIFASIAIYFDKPFSTGDFIQADKDLGTIEKIGIKTTRIRTLQGEELVISNKELTESRIQNFSRMHNRRVEIKFGLEYTTNSQKLREVPKIIELIIKEIEICEFKRCHFTEFGDYSLNFEIVYNLRTEDYNIFRDVQQKINLEIKESFEKQNIQMAFPTQTIILSK